MHEGDATATLDKAEANLRNEDLKTNKFDKGDRKKAKLDKGNLQLYKTRVPPREEKVDNKESGYRGYTNTEAIQIKGAA